MYKQKRKTEGKRERAKVGIREIMTEREIQGEREGLR